MAEGQTAQKKPEQTDHTIAIRGFSYDAMVPNPLSTTGEQMVNRRFALRGQTVSLLAHDAERGKRLGAFLKQGESIDEIGTGQSATLFSAVDATDTELINWIKDDQPPAQEVVDASEGDAEVAERLLTAENAATGGDPRKSVVAGLSAVIEKSNE